MGDDERGERGRGRGRGREGERTATIQSHAASPP